MGLRQPPDERGHERLRDVEVREAPARGEIEGIKGAGGIGGAVVQGLAPGVIRQNGEAMAKAPVRRKLEGMIAGMAAAELRGDGAEIRSIDAARLGSRSGLPIDFRIPFELEKQMLSHAPDIGDREYPVSYLLLDVHVPLLNAAIAEGG